MVVHVPVERRSVNVRGGSYGTGATWYIGLRTFGWVGALGRGVDAMGVWWPEDIEGAGLQ